MSDFIFGLINFIVGVCMAGFGFTIVLAGLKILYTGLGWLI